MLQRLVVWLLLAFMVSGCAAPTTQRAEISDVALAAEVRKQKALAMRTWFDRLRRLENLAFPLQVAAVPLCEEEYVLRNPGFSYMHLGRISEEWHDVASEEFGFGRELTIFNVVPGSPADKAGLQKGDVFVNIDGESIALDGPFYERFVDDDFAKLLKKQGEDGVLNLTVLRGGKTTDVVIRPVMGCFYPVRYVGEDHINALADGDSVLVFKGLMNFTDDTELSAVIAHEIAHNAMQHIEATTLNRAGGAILDIVLIGKAGVDPGMRELTGKAYSQEFEAEADYVGLYIMARAGLPLETAPNIWRRMAVENPEGINKGIQATHPSHPERYLGMDNAIKEIRAKQARGEPLMPNLKEKQSAQNTGASP